MIAISRDTMTEIATYDVKGNYIGDSVNHLGLAYAFGNGKDTSCEYMVHAVSKLFYGIPINGYAAFNMETISKLNDAVGGVTVTVPEGEDLSKKLKAGTAVTLKGSRQRLLYDIVTQRRKEVIICELPDRKSLC